VLEVQMFSLVFIVLVGLEGFRIDRAWSLFWTIRDVFNFKTRNCDTAVPPDCEIYLGSWTFEEYGKFDFGRTYRTSCTYVVSACSTYRSYVLIALIRFYCGITANKETLNANEGRPSRNISSTYGTCRQRQRLRITLSFDVSLFHA